MNYVPLYTKYRPQTLGEIVGQEHIKQALSNAIKLDKVSHVYLFTGPRGTGKTSTARILAKSLNCKDGPTLTPCGKCESCQNIINSVPIDVIEIDAASNRKVEDTQEILEKIQYVPVNGKYKIYIIDEVHMLSTHAFNALLKTLEEPPANVIFILATTEIQKVPDTIKSRCQRYDFRRITVEDIVSRLKYIAKEEKIKITDDALNYIARTSFGGMRDSIGLLDQLSVFDKEITTDDVDSILGRLSFDVLKSLADDIISSKGENAVETLEKIYEAGNEPLQILTGLLEYFRNVLILKQCKDEQIPKLLDGMNSEHVKILREQSEKLELHQIIFLIERSSHYINELKSSTNGRLWLEVGIIDLANLTVNTSLLELQDRLSALENGTVTVAPVVQPMPRPVVQEIPKPVKIEKTNDEVPFKEDVKPQAEVPVKAEIPKAEPPKSEPPKAEEKEFTPVPKSAPGAKNSTADKWKSILLNIQSPATQAMLKWAIPVKVESDEVIVSFKNEAMVKQISESKKDSIVAAADKYFNQQKTKLIIKVFDANDLKKESASAETKKEEPQAPVVKNEVPQKTEETLQEVEPMIEEYEPEPDIEEENTETESKRLSDQTEMIMEVFSGRHID
ncbi:DNA polymerase III subunit gamma/tau [bacterium]|nr:DNA polymerase III subunit gamma/tau [bacterium]